MIIITTEVLCDECEKRVDPEKTRHHLATGHVVIDGDDCGRDCFLCDNHTPQYTREYFYQPTNCTHVWFFWPGVSPESMRPISYKEHADGYYGGKQIVRIVKPEPRVG